MKIRQAVKSNEVPSSLTVKPRSAIRSLIVTCKVLDHALTPWQSEQVVPLEVCPFTIPKHLMELFLCHNYFSLAHYVLSVKLLWNKFTCLATETSRETVIPEWGIKLV